MPRVLISINAAWNVTNFRAGLVRALVADGHEVLAAVPDDGALDKVAALGARPIALPMTSGSTSILGDLALLARYWRLIRREAPDIYLGWTIKPNTYGSLAARLAGAARINNISGLGTAFIRSGWLTRIAEALYRIGLSGSSTVFFQNPDDRALFLQRGLVQASQTALLPGSGIDLDHYDPAHFPASKGGTFRFLLVARLIRDKGVEEFVAAARTLRQSHPQARFQLLGFLDVDNRTAISRTQLETWQAEGVIEYLGAAEDVRAHLAAADCIVLPSYREGLSRVLLEAAAMERPAIASDVPGCRDVIVSGRTGLLCKVRDAASLAARMAEMLAMPVEQRQAMGRAARAHVRQSFSEGAVIAAYRRAIGLGYVGLPLALRLSAYCPVCGFDTDRGRIAELQVGIDRTHEAEPEALRAAQQAGALLLHSDPAACRGADIYIVTVPTPVDCANKPDLSLIERASETVGAMLDPGRQAIVVYESTVYPGVTEDICGPILEEASGLKRGRDFFLGYSPERINPGDREHTVDRITKVVAGENPDVTARLCALYGQVTKGGVFPATSIRVAEAAKVIENAQRDINIAFVNEVAQITHKLGISIWDVLEAAGTKWNFLPFQPGLVGGHCIGVDPYYLSHCAQVLGHSPEVILAGRAINDGMANWIATTLGAQLPPAARVLVLGLTFKENVPDLRNSKVADLVSGLSAQGHAVSVHDPLASAAEAHREHGIDLLPHLPQDRFDAVVLAVPHAVYRMLGSDALAALVTPGGLFADLKNAAPDLAGKPELRLWRI